MIRNNYVENLISSINEYYNCFINDNNLRYKSWDHCYQAFSEARDKNFDDKLIDYLSLHLAFYLASWGMYRGSSFLLKYDYTIHKDAIRIICNKKYNGLIEITCENLVNSNNIDLLFELKYKLNEYYANYRAKAKAIGNDKDISDTLITKILLGTLSCVPAFDRYLKRGLKACELPQVFSKETIKFICESCKEIDFSKCAFQDKNNGISYPQMKLLDMGLWYIGKECFNKEKKRIR